MATKNYLILMYLTIFSLKFATTLVFFYYTHPKHDNRLGVDLKITIFWFTHPIINVSVRVH